MKLEKVNHLLVITITIISLVFFLSACSSKEHAIAYHKLGLAYSEQGN